MSRYNCAGHEPGESEPAGSLRVPSQPVTAWGMSWTQTPWIFKARGLGRGCLSGAGLKSEGAQCGVQILCSLGTKFPV